MIKENEKIKAEQKLMLVTWVPGSKNNRYTEVTVHHVTPTGIIVLNDLSKYRPDGRPIKKRERWSWGNFEELEVITKENTEEAERQLLVRTLKGVLWDNVDLATLRLVMAALLTDSVKKESHG